jgi:hypothetical protein
MKTEIIALYSPVERAVLSKYFGLDDPAPQDLAGIDVSTPVDPEDWEEAANGIAPLPSEMEFEELMLENAVARICLEAIQQRLPQWAAISGGEVTLGRKISAARRASDRNVRPRHLFTINWADSGPGFSWPEAYHVVKLPGYELFVVTASADSPDANGYCDFAIGWFRPSRRQKQDVRACITSHWANRRDVGQERWAYLFDTGSIDESTADEWADDVWTDEGP